MKDHGCLVGAISIGLILLAIFVISFIISAGIIWVICWCFNLMFSWKAALGLWLILLLLGGAFKSQTTVTK